MCLSIFLQYTVKVEKGDYVLKLQVGKKYFCGKISLFHSLKPARDMCSAPFRLIDNWNSVYVLQGYHYFSQRIVFPAAVDPR